MPHPELMQGLPRRTRMDTTAKMAIILGLGIFWSIGVFFLGISLLQGHTIQHVKSTGVTTVAVLQKVGSVQLRHGETGYEVGYIFVPETHTTMAQSFVGHASVSAAQLQSMHVGQTVSVTYDPKAPGTSYLTDQLNGRWAHPYANFVFMLQLVAVLFGGGTLVGAGLVWRAYAKTTRLLRWGSVAPAHITGTRQVHKGRAWYTEASYVFQDATGATVQGLKTGLPSQRSMDRGEGLTTWASIMNAPTVVYDPKKSTRNQLYPSFLVTCVP